MLRDVSVSSAAAMDIAAVFRAMPPAPGGLRLAFLPFVLRLLFVILEMRVGGGQLPPSGSQSYSSVG